MSDEYVATCQKCGNNFDEVDINMMDYDLDLCGKCEKEHLKEIESFRKQATIKVQSEIEQNKENAFIKTIGEFLIKEIGNHSYAAEAILKPDKTIKGSLQAMENEARKKATNGMAMFTQEEGFALVLDYFGIVYIEINVPDKPLTIKKKKARFDVSLNDFL